MAIMEGFFGILNYNRSMLTVSIYLSEIAIQYSHQLAFPGTWNPMKPQNRRYTFFLPSVENWIRKQPFSGTL